jgi:hypothetical protein
VLASYILAWLLTSPPPTRAAQPPSVPQPAVGGSLEILPAIPAALAQQVGVYPNPATSAVTLELPPNLSRQAVTLNLVNAVG